MADIKDKIERVVCALETGQREADYSRVSIAHDGPGDSLQISYGKMQSAEFASLCTLIMAYVSSCGAYADRFKPYLDKIGETSLVSDSAFIQLLKDAGEDEVMKACQDSFFDLKYWNRMIEWAKNHEITLNLSKLVLFDSFIQSGSILKDIRNSFAALSPDSGGDERKWTANYVFARKKWLQNKQTKVIDELTGEETFVPDIAVQKSVYRMDTMIGILKANDWDLALPINVIDGKGKTITIVE